MPAESNSLPIQLANPAQLVDRKADSDIIENKNSAKFLGPVLLDPALLVLDLAFLIFCIRCVSSAAVPLKCVFSHAVFALMITSCANGSLVCRTDLLKIATHTSDRNRI